MTARPAARPRIALTLAVTAGLVTLPPLPAQAHDTLVSSDPASGQQLATAPDHLTLTFSADLIEVGSAVMVTAVESPSGGPGADHATGLEITGPDVTITVDDLPVGHYDVRWRVVSSDGHPISGVVPFSIGDAGERPATGATGSPSAPASTAGEPATTADDGPGTGTTAAPATASTPGPWRTIGVALGGAAAAVALLALGWWWRSRRTAPRP